MRKSVLIVMASAAALAAGIGRAAAMTEQPVEKTREICQRATAEAERALNIPAHLLGAISLAESGRWDETRQASFAWPWTVMAEGKGRYYDTKAQAVAAVRKLMARGLTNIDVGCMQVNLYYHGGAFKNIEQALDPAANTAYAGEYLRNLFGAAKSWTKAAAYYHSMTPELGDEYRKKVVGLWHRTRRLASVPATDGLDDLAAMAAVDDRLDDEAAAAAAAAFDAAVATPRSIVSIDMERTARLNARLRIARTHERALAFAERRARQLATWRDGREAPATLGQLAAMQRARVTTENTRAPTDDKTTRAEAFAARRQEQLRQWRAGHGSAAPPESGT